MILTFIKLKELFQNQNYPKLEDENAITLLKDYKQLMSPIHIN